MQKKIKILERLDRYREIEINNLWQRSVFLGTFLVLGYTGYGFLLDKMLSPTDTFYQLNQSKYFLKASIETNLQMYHFVTCVLAAVNIIFSVLWITMAKGSKAWYEVYENAIYFVENSEKEKFSWKEIRCEIDLRRKNINDTYKCQNRNNPSEFVNQKEDCLFSVKSGGYSPSKINIAIGHINFFMWLIVLTVHLIILSINTYEIINRECLIFLIILVVWVTFMVVASLQINKTKGWIESSYLSDKIKK